MVSTLFHNLLSMKLFFLQMTLSSFYQGTTGTLQNGIPQRHPLQK